MRWARVTPASWTNKFATYDSFTHALIWPALIIYYVVSHVVIGYVIIQFPCCIRIIIGLLTRAVNIISRQEKENKIVLKQSVGLSLGKWWSFIIHVHRWLTHHTDANRVCEFRTRNMNYIGCIEHALIVSQHQSQQRQQIRTFCIFCSGSIPIHMSSIHCNEIVTINICV